RYARTSFVNVVSRSTAILRASRTTLSSIASVIFRFMTTYYVIHVLCATFAGPSFRTVNARGLVALQYRSFLISLLRFYPHANCSVPSLEDAMGRFSRSWALVKQSFAILRSDKQLMLFPILSAVSCLIVTALIVGGGALALIPSITAA